MPETRNQLALNVFHYTDAAGLIGITPGRSACRVQWVLQELKKGDEALISALGSGQRWQKEKLLPCPAPSGCGVSGLKAILS